MEVFEFLRTELRARRWNMSDFARAAGVSKQAAGQWLSEDASTRLIPSPASCQKIAAALGIDPDYILELAGHRKPRPDRPSIDPVQSELDTRLARLAATLSQYPRVFWLAVVEASERMATAGEALHAAPPVSATSEERISAADQAIARPHHAKDEGLAKSSRAPLLAAAW